MKIEYSIRKAVPNDVKTLINLLQSLFSIETDFQFDESKQGYGLQLMMEAPDRRCIMVAEANGQVIGMCSAQLIISTAAGGTAALVEDMVVAGEYRGRGMGKQLLSAIEDWAVKQGAKRLELLADRDNIPALKFYEKMDWKQTRLVCFHKK